MNHSKKIEISKSSLISLKAELLRKQDEVQKAKLEPKNQMNNFVPYTKFDDNEKVTKSDIPIKLNKVRDAEDAEAHRKSKDALEKKSLLYEHLSQGIVQSDYEEHFLVNFKKKSNEGDNNDYNDDVVKDHSDDDSDEEWIDYVDCLGRTRRCHKTDLEYIKKQDENLKDSLGPKTSSENVSNQFVKEGESKIEETPDPYKEMLHKQWDKREEDLMKKDTVFYEDVLFNEARTHGVGYYALSGDEEVRARQQAELKKVHEETERARAAAADLKARRESALQQRVRAARARQRARAGLPPEEEPEAPTPVTTMLLDFVEQQKKASSENARAEREAREAEAQKEREKFVREWDVGKEDLKKERFQVLSQEQWVDKKRQDRPNEFAPPTTSTNKSKQDSATFTDKGFYIDTEGDPNLKTWKDVRPNKSKPVLPSFKNPDESLYFTTKKRKDEIKNKYFDMSVNKGETFKPTPIHDECEEFEERIEERKKERTGAEIEPPPTYDYYGPVNKKVRKNDSNVDVNEAFAKGLEHLQNKALEKDKRKNRAMLDDY